VAANWTEASAPIYALGEDGWYAALGQVADCHHSARIALERGLAKSLQVCGGDPSEAEALALDAWWMDD